MELDENGVLILHFKCPKDTQLSGKQVQTCFEDQMRELPKCELIKDNKIEDKKTKLQLKPFKDEINQNEANKISKSSYHVIWWITVLLFVI